MARRRHANDDEKRSKCKEEAVNTNRSGFIRIASVRIEFHSDKNLAAFILPPRCRTKLGWSFLCLLNHEHRGSSTTERS